ncbi:MAG: hypothetical protein K2Y29_00380 [Beijerinckiaceae bacterium]|nr:hypothetical protein [Beijerinckiaceae bacterium]
MIYRGSGDWGPGKGSNLTAAEVDANFWEIEQRLAALETYAGAAETITNIEISGSVLTIFTSNGGEYPVTLAIPRIASSVDVSGATYEPALGDANKYLRFTNAAGCDVTLPDDATVEFPLSTELHVRQAAAGIVTIGAASGVTINIEAGFDAATSAQGALVTLKKVGPDEWDLFGRLLVTSA